MRADARRIIRVGSRGSLLALAQTRHVVGTLTERHPEAAFEIVVIQTKGDVILDTPLAKIGDKGLFTKEIEQALLGGEADLAVHSLKDMPARLPDGLALGAVPARVEAGDALVSPIAASIAALPAGARVGTSSLRRRAQLLHGRPDLAVEDLRGNVDTRLRKLREGRYDAIILAAAGLIRLGLAREITARIPVAEMVPAVGQGALALECRADDTAIRNLLAAVHHPPTDLAVTAERAFLAVLEGGCQVPMAAHATLDGGRIRLTGLIATLDGRRVLRHEADAPADPAAAARLGQAVAGHLLDEGGREILAAILGGHIA